MPFPVAQVDEFLSGIMLNNMLGEDDICSPDPSHWFPGSRLPSMMAPCIVEYSNKTMALGSGGSKRIRSSLAQVLSNLIDFEMTLEEAISAPRMNWDGRTMQTEPGFPKDSIDANSDKIAFNIWPEKEFFFGGTHAVVCGQEAVGDRRRQGFACVQNKEKA